MKKKFLFVALSALALTACVNDETIEVNPGDALTFRATSGNATKSQITTTSTISDFKVWGYYQNEAEKQSNVPFMEDQLVQRISGVWTYSPTRFWPESGTIDFYSVSPYETPGISITKTEQKIKDYTVNTNISLQKDLLYAVNMGCSKAANGQTGVEVNFRHALSQIVFQAKNTNSNIKVDIEGVKVVNVVSKGTFTYPQETTSPNLTGTDHDTEYDDTWGTWDLSSTTGDVVTYEAGVTERTGITPSSEEVALTTVGGGELLLLPQTLSEWVPSTGESGTGSRFLINCKIWNVSGDDEVLLWPGKNEYSEVAIPIPADTKWKQGKKYVYTFIFGEGAGYTPDGKPTPLIPVRFDVTVDDFQQGEDIPVDMEGEENDPALEGALNLDENEGLTGTLTYGGGNCWVIPSSDEAVSYYFDATKEGQSDDPVGTVVTPKDATRKAIKGLYRDVSIGSIEYTQTGKMLFTIPANQTGNAIVKVTDGTGQTLWSWHIWVVDNNDFMDTSAPSQTFMERNLGAENPKSDGYFYQWGNKNHKINNMQSSAITIAPATLPEAISRPGFLAWGQESNDKSWFKADNVYTINNFWSDEEQLKKFNPAPKGWTIPTKADFEKIINDKSFVFKYNVYDNTMTYNGKTVTITGDGLAYNNGFEPTIYGASTTFYWLRDAGNEDHTHGTCAYFECYKNKEGRLSIKDDNAGVGYNIRPIKE